MRYKRSVQVACVALALGFAVTARGWDEPELNQKMMQAEKLEKTVRKDLAANRNPAAAESAVQLAALFDEIEDFWGRKGVESAQERARDVSVRAQALAKLVERGDFQGAKLAAKNVHANCEGCHAAYSVRPAK